MTYPVAYRRAVTGARSGLGSRLSRRGSHPIPANDNRPPAPVIPFPLRPPSTRQAIRAGLRLTIGRHPALRIGMEAFEYWMNQMQSNPQPGVVMGPDWTLVHDCGRKPLVPLGVDHSTCHITWHIHPYGVPPGPGPIEYSTFFIQNTYVYTGIVFGNATYLVAKNFRKYKSQGGPEDAPRNSLRDPAPIPAVIPNIDPFSVPVNNPEVTPQKLPHRALPRRQWNPFRAEQSVRGYEVGSAQGHPLGGQRPVGRIKREPARRGEKERKTAVRNPAWVDALMHALTEPLDVLNAAWDALPQHIRYQAKVYQVRNKLPRKRGIRRKAEDVYKHWDKIDLEKFAENLIKNEIEDFVIGKIGRKAAEISSRGTDPIGLQRRLGELGSVKLG